MATVAEHLLVSPEDPTRPESPAFWEREIMGELWELKIPLTGIEKAKRRKQAVWLAAFVRQAGATLACGIAGTTHTTMMRWRNEDPIFQRCHTLAKEAQSDTLIHEARRRAVEGVDVTIRDKHGKSIGVEKKYSDTLLHKLMQGFDPEKRFWRIPSQAQGNDSAEWRTALAKLMDKDPEAMQLVEALADRMVGEGQPAPAE